jgi:hypothetical protein
MAIGAAGAAPATNWQSRVSAALLKIYQSAGNAAATAPSGSHSSHAHTMARFDSSGRVEIDVHFDCAIPAPKRELSAAGLVVSTAVKLPPFCVVEGWVEPKALPAIASVNGVKLVKLPVYSSHHTVPANRPATKSAPMPQTAPHRDTPLAVPQNSIDGAAINIMHSDLYAQQTGGKGSGVTVAIISDDVSNLATIQARGELPANVTLYPSGGTNSTPTDEGTMMLEEVHAVAPGASLAFCGPTTEVQYGSCLQAIASAGVHIAADDLGFPDDLMSSNSPFAQGVQNLLSANANLILFSAAGNDNQAYWQGSYNPSTFTLNGSTSLTCSANGQIDFYLENFGSQLYDTLTLNAPLKQILFLQWADPFGHNVSNFDFYILDGSFNVVACVPGAGSPDTFDGLLPSPPLAAGTYNLLIATPTQTFSGKFLKLDAYANGAGTLSITSTGSVDSPQKFVSGVQTIGAVDGIDGIGNTIEPYSATGPIQIEFPTPSTIQAPVFVAPDDVVVDNAGTLFTSNPFRGTSAAVPNAAAVLALLESSFPGVPVAALLTAVRSGAAQLGTGVPNGVYGYGRVDAIGALNAVALPTISPIGAVSIVGGQNSGQLQFTMTGVGTLTVSGSSDNTALVAFGTGGSASVTAGCGTTTNTCSLLITPPLGQSGTAHVTVQTADGGQRVASTTFTVTVTKPARPAITITGGASQTIMQGGAVNGVTFVMAGTGPLTASASSSNATLLPNSSITVSNGCGTTANLDTCVATLTPASGQSGTATITIAAQDSYGQTGINTATLQVNAPPPPPSHGGGGGAVDLWILISLSALAMGHVRRSARNRLGQLVQ